LVLFGWAWSGLTGSPAKPDRAPFPGIESRSIGAFPWRNQEAA
jgi:hypothetical protein